MAIKIGINGFGRIGRVILRLAHQDPEIEVVQINDIGPPKTLAHLLKYDEILGTFPAEVEAAEKGILIDGREVHCSTASSPSEIKWVGEGVDVILECTGIFRDRSHCEEHLRSGAKKVVVSAPGQDSDLTIVMGVNEADYKPDQHDIISNASCTTNCLAPIAKTLDENLGIVHGYMTTIHSYTNDQRLLSGPHKDMRRARAAALNQIPTTTGAARAIGLVIPKLKGKLEGISIRVPTPNVSLVDLVVDVEKETSKEEINGFFEKAANNSLKGILNISHEPLVSSDYNGSRFSAVVDGLSTDVVNKKLVKVLAWYDNETGFSQRMVDLTKMIGRNLR